MARIQPDHPIGTSHLSPDVSHSRRVTTSLSKEDLFFYLANDEPSDTSEHETQKKYDLPLRSNTVKYNGSSPGPSYPRRTTSTQVNTSTLSSPPPTESQAKPANFLSRPSYSSTASDQLRDVSSDRASLSSTDNILSKYDDLTITASAQPESAASKGRSWDSNQPQLPSSPFNGHKRSQRHTFRPSNLSHETSRDGAQSYHTQFASISSDRSPVWNSTGQEKTESVASTNAASTVWDELEELRQRIRRLEYNGSRAKSAGGGDSGGTGAAGATDESPDRPYTATTMTTTSSASNAGGKRTLSSPTQFVQSNSPNSYPLLRSAMQKAKANVYPEVYKSLEASVSDALDIAAALPKSGSSPQISEFGETSSADLASLRRLRRKSESLCRSLTELCIALCEDSSRQTLKPAPTAASIDSPINPPYRSNDNSPLSYLEERRARLDRTGSVPYNPSSRASSTIGPSTIHDDAASSYSRQSVTGNYSRRRQSNPGTEEVPNLPGRTLSRTSIYQDEGEDRDPTIRAPSRALSEIQHTRYSATRNAHKFSRDYTLRHPLPDRPPPTFQQSNVNTNQSTPTLRPIQTGVSNTRQHLRLNSDSPLDADDQRSVSRQSVTSARSATLAERLEARRQLQNRQQVASAGQLGSITSAAANTASRTRAASTSKRPTSSGRPSRFERSGTSDDLMSP